MPILKKEELTKENIDFFNLFEGYVAIDIETSGSDKQLLNKNINNKPEILEIGAVKLVNGSIEEFHILIKNKYPVSTDTFELCKGIMQEDLDNGAELEQAIYMLKNFIENSILICHNGKFEKAFFEYYYNEIGLDFTNKIIDIMELAAVLEPYHKVYKLDYFIKNITNSNEDEAHRGLIDSYDTLCIASTLIARFIDKNKDENYNIKFDNLFEIVIDWPWLRIIKNARYKKDIPRYVRLKTTKDEKSNTLAVNRNISVDILNDVNTCREFYNESYRFREEQKNICNYMLEAIENNQIGIIQGPVGIGKTMAIALVAIIVALRNINKKVAIVTKTKSLMEELLNNDLPAMKRTMGIQDLNYVGLKGKANYICFLKLEDEIKRGNIYNFDLEKRILFIILYRRYLMGYIEIGDNEIVYAIKKLFIDKNIRNDFIQDANIDEFISEFSCDGDCNMKNCSYSKECKFIDIYNNAHNSDILVINQSLLAKWPYQSIILDNVICDESHELIEEANKLNTTTIDIGIVKGLVIKYSKNLKELIKNSSKSKEEKYLIFIKQMNLYVNDIINSIDETFSYYMKKLGNINQEYDVSEFIYKDENNLIKNVYDNILNLYLIIVKLPIDFIMYGKILEYFIEISEDLKKVLAFKEYEICSINVNQKLNKVIVSVHRQIETSNFYRKCLNNSESTIFMSGTLQVPDNITNDSFKYFKTAMGINGELKKILKEPLLINPIFDFKNRLKIGIVDDAIKYTPSNENEFITDFSKFIEDVAIDVPSNLLVLFTNNKRRDKVAYILQQKLGEKNISICTSKNELDKLNIGGEKVIFLGTRGQFQGTSLVGDRLNIVILEKLPNEFFHNPLIELERKINKCNIKDGNEKCKECINNCYGKINRNTVAILLQQIYGRVIRGEYDYGYLIIYNGLQSKGYMDSIYYRNLIASKDEYNNLCNIEEGSKFELIKKIHSSIYSWIIMNIEKLLDDERLIVKDRCIDNVINGLDYKRAFEEALSTELKNKNLDYKVEICLKDNGCIKLIKVIRKGETYNINNNRLIKSIGNFSREIRTESGNL